MAVNKVVYGNRSLIDLTNDTVTADTLAVGKTAHAADGSIITGTMKNWVIPIDPTVTPTDEGSLWITTT